MPIRLDQRLAAVASLVRADSAADIGCDHGKLAYFLVSTDRVKRAIATDISEESLKKARALATENGVEKVMITRLGDGLDPVESEEVDAVIIAGLGGDVIAGILDRAFEHKKRFESYVLSPNTHPEKVRRELKKIGQRVTFDRAVECAGKLYTVIRSEAGEDDLDEIQIAFGKFYKSDRDFEKRARQELKFVRGLLEAGASSTKLEERAQMLEKALYNIENEE